MTVYLAFSEPRDVDGFPATIANSTTGKNSWTRTGFRFASADINVIPLNATLTEGWFHFRFTGAGNSSFVNTDYKISLVDATGGALGGFYKTTNEINYIRTPFTSDYNLSEGSSTHDIDMHWNIHATLGYMYIYNNGTLVAAFEGDTTTGGQTGADSIRLRGMNGTTGGTLYHYSASELIVSSTPTLGARLVSTAIDADGAEIDWVGGFADINASTYASDGTYISSATNGEISTFTKAAAAAIATDEFVEAVVLNFRANAEPSSPVNNLSPVVRLAGVNYFEPAVALGTIVSSQSYSIALNPVTGLAWELADVNSAELGFRADT
jgi:hypothetical protein